MINHLIVGTVPLQAMEHFSTFLRKRSTYDNWGLKDVKRAIKDLEKPMGDVWGQFAEYECVRDWLNCCTQRHSRLYEVIAISCRIVRDDPYLDGR